MTVLGDTPAPVPLKRFLVFTGDRYYPAGGWGDFVDSFDNVEAAKWLARQTCTFNLPERWGHVVDLTTGKIVFKG